MYIEKVKKNSKKKTLDKFTKSGRKSKTPKHLLTTSSDEASTRKAKTTKMDSTTVLQTLSNLAKSITASSSAHMHQEKEKDITAVETPQRLNSTLNSHTFASTPLSNTFSTLIDLPKRFPSQTNEPLDLNILRPSQPSNNIDSDQFQGITEMCGSTNGAMFQLMQQISQDVK